MDDKKTKQQHLEIFENEFYVHADALYNFAYNLVFSEADANDLVQETYMKAFKAVDKYILGTNAKAWLFTILKHTFINDYRKKAKRPKQTELDQVSNFHNEEEGTRYSGHVNLEVEMFDSLMGDEVTQAINSLPSEFRVVILLCDVEGFTYEEISKIIDIPIGTVRSRLHRSRNMLKEKLKAYGESKGFKSKR